MGFYVNVDYTIKGQVDEFEDRDVIEAKLRLLAAKYGLKITENEEDF